MGDEEELKRAKIKNEVIKTTRSHLSESSE